MSLWIKAVLIWLGFALVGALNGALREHGLLGQLGPRCALAVSGLLLSAMVFGLTVLWLPHLAPLTARHCWAIGGLWVLLTLLFELLVARLTQGSARAGLAGIMRVGQGNLMLLVLLVTLAAPYLAARLLDLI